ncbi:excinuclease ABC subunit UvrC [Rothia sp. ZJ1223]|uniref:excinuclease ABC subunit UvrC n=1 Tax=Rothia sp. ZJ1223 TaxID=2811098 RepID=UPI00195A69C9|nr:excinuclease ABC subunit UvrC [Rothia sp. ZJ1223]MBM7050615.1 excinuclease ABC subunit UvrC [Rothia sp. ZJ1223]
MANPEDYRPATGEIPTQPGVYRFRDEFGRIIYVGKAKNLRNRLNSYFAQVKSLSPKTYAMVHTAASVEWTIVGSELESLQLEYTWIKEYKPRFNIAFRDDKSYPYLAITLKDRYPRAMVMRGEKKKGVRYFGPYSQAWAIRETLDALLRVFPVRTCTNGVFNRAERSGRPCLLGYIDKCSAPCIEKISREDHQQLAQDLAKFMAGGAEKFIAQLKDEMKSAAAEFDFEKAARLRDDIGALEKAFERNAVVLADSVDADVFAYDQDDLEAAVQVFFVRGGRIRGQRGWIVEKTEDSTDAELIEQLLQQVYGEVAASVAAGNTDEERAHQQHEIPQQILVPALPENKEQLEQWLGGVRGAKVSISVPQRGEKVELMHTVAENAKHSLSLHKTRRAGDLTTRSASLVELQESLELPDPLMRIECYDISHVQGTHVVASMVVFEDGLPKKSDYRKFSITGDAARDDTASMYDVIHRRFKRYLQDASERQQAPRASGEVSLEYADAKEPVKFAYPPNLVVVDGGQPQVSAAQAALSDLGITDIYVVGIAKRLEELWLLDDDFPVILPRTSPALYLVQRIRDEAHRFAITFHRSKRGKAMLASSLDGVSGLGPAKREQLVNHFGSYKQLSQASEEQLLEVSGIGPSMAAKILAHFAQETAEDDSSATAGGNGDASSHRKVSARDVNLTTGEVL